jgi:hypothetical protein
MVGEYLGTFMNTFPVIVPRVLFPLSRCAMAAALGRPTFDQAYAELTNWPEKGFKFSQFDVFGHLSVKLLPGYTTGLPCPFVYDMMSKDFAYHPRYKNSILRHQRMVKRLRSVRLDCVSNFAAPFVHLQYAYHNAHQEYPNPIDFNRFGKLSVQYLNASLSLVNNGLCLLYFHYANTHLPGCSEEMYKLLSPLTHTWNPHSYVKSFAIDRACQARLAFNNVERQPGRKMCIHAYPEQERIQGKTGPNFVVKKANIFQQCYPRELPKERGPVVKGVVRVDAAVIFEETGAMKGLPQEVVEAALRGQLDFYYNPNAAATERGGGSKPPVTTVWH